MREVAVLLLDLRLKTELRLAGLNLCSCSGEWAPPWEEGAGRWSCQESGAKVEGYVPVACESIDDCRDRETSLLWNENMSCKFTGSAERFQVRSSMQVGLCASRLVADKRCLIPQPLRLQERCKSVAYRRRPRMEQVVNTATRRVGGLCAGIMGPLEHEALEVDGGIKAWVMRKD